MHLGGAQRDRMNDLMHQAHTLGMQLTHNVVDPAALGSLELTGSTAAAVQQLPPGLQRRFRPVPALGGGGGVAGLACAADTPSLHSLLRHAGDEGLRRAAWEACHRQPAANLAVLDALVEVRWAGLLRAAALC